MQGQSQLPLDPHDAAQLLASASDEDVPEAAWPKQLADLVDVLVAHFRRRGRPMDEALQEAREIALALSFYMGGRQLYLPNATQLKAAFRHAEIYHQHRHGDRCDVLALRHDMTVRQVEKIVARQAELRFRRRQRPLFP